MQKTSVRKTIKGAGQPHPHLLTEAKFPRQVEASFPLSSSGFRGLKRPRHPSMTPLDSEDYSQAIMVVAAQSGAGLVGSPALSWLFLRDK
jgi:hypothetical protein